MRRKTPEVFEKEFYDLLKDEYTLLSDYELTNVHVKVIHNTCKHEYRVTPNVLLRGGRCPKCNGNGGRRKTTKQFKKEVFNLVGDEYSVIGEYINRATNIKIKHNTCGRVYDVEPGNFLHTSRCIECYYQSMRLSEEEVQDKIRDSLGDSYHLVGEYVSLQHPSKIYHEKCGSTFKTRIGDIIQKRVGCRKCSSSRGEEYIMDYLHSKGIPYEYPKRFDDLKNISYLFYDFYLPEHRVLIEFQGEQHFKPKNFGGEPKEVVEKNLNKQKYHDKLKMEYADNNGYILLTPAYKINTYEKLIDYMDKNLLSEVTQGTFNQK